MLTTRQAEGKRWIDLGVRNNGAGISPAEQAKIFSPFISDGGEIHSRKAAGVDLHLSQKLAEMLGGRISFRSGQDKGSAFTLTLSHS